MPSYQPFQYRSPKKESATLSDSATFNNKDASRAELFEELKRRSHYDLVVIGGGIQGATLAHVAAFNGLRTALLERDDYGQHTSRKTSKLAHGGLRYLEQGDIRQVWEGIRARQDLLTVAPHLVHDQNFVFPIAQNEGIFRYKVAIGLALYSLFAGRWARFKQFSSTQLLTERYGGGFYFHDGMMNDLRLVQERILAARQEGALCLNHTEVQTLSRKPDDSYRITYIDRHTTSEQKSSEITAGIVMNCAGPWAPFQATVDLKKLGLQALYSRGTHLFFSFPWTSEALVLPINEAGKRVAARYYFVLPYAYGTLVGTTEREQAAPSNDPKPDQNEIDEILARLAQDFPGGPFTRDKVAFVFAGERTLVRKAHTHAVVSKISRRHIWLGQGGVFTLLGGKYTSALWTATEGLLHALKAAGKQQKVFSVKGRLLPGAFGLHERREQFSSQAHNYQIQEKIITRCLQLWGGRALDLTAFENWHEVVGQEFLRGEIELAIRSEQACTVDDIVSRRLNADFWPESLSELRRVAAELLVALAIQS